MKGTLIFGGHHKHSNGSRGGIIIVSCGTDFRDDNLCVVFERGRAGREDFNLVDDVGFD